MSTVTQRQLDKIRAEEEELVKAIAEGDTAPSKDASPKQSTPENLLEPSDISADVTAEEGAKKEEVVRDLDYWKNRALEAEYRFGKYKSSTDHTIYTLRTTNKDLREENLRLTQTIDRLTTRPATSDEITFSEDTIAVLGEDATSAIKSVLDRTNAKVRETEAKLKKVTEREMVDKIRTDAQEAYRSFVSSLSRLVPDCERMNTDDGFLDWLEQPDFTGVKRVTRLQNAQKIGDVERVAGFFNEYKQLQLATQVKDSIENRIGPVQKSSSESIKKETQDKISVSFIKKFEADVAKGRYRGRESERDVIDKRIEQAYLSGNIIDS